MNMLNSGLVSDGYMYNYRALRNECQQRKTTQFSSYIKQDNCINLLLTHTAIPFCPLDGSTQQNYIARVASYRWKAMEESCIQEPS